MNPRILFVSFTSKWTGPTNSLLLLLKHLGPRYEGAVLLPGRGDFVEVLEREGFAYHSLPTVTKSALPAMYRIMRTGRYALVYGNNTHRSSRLAFAAAKLAGIPFVCHVRESGLDKSWYDLGYLRFADAVVAVSESAARSVGRFVRPGRLHVAYNGVSLDGRFLDPGVDGDRTRTRLELGVPDDALMVLGIGHVCPHKGQEHAVEAMRRVRESGASVHLCLVGALDRCPDYVSRVRRQIAAAGLEDRVQILGFREDVDRMLAAADVFLHTSLSDAHPRSVLEAMASGLPVVAFEVDGVAETLTQGKTGRLVAPGDDEALAAALLDLQADPGSRERLGRQAREAVVRDFTAAATAKKVASVLDSALGLGSPEDLGAREGGRATEAGWA